MITADEEVFCIMLDIGKKQQQNAKYSYGLFYVHQMTSYKKSSGMSPIVSMMSNPLLSALEATFVVVVQSLFSV
jgi:hypothetical protein